MLTYGAFFLFQLPLFTVDAQERIVTVLSWTPVIQYIHVFLILLEETPHMVVLLSVITKSFTAVSP